MRKPLDGMKLQSVLCALLLVVVTPAVGDAQPVEKLRTELRKADPDTSVIIGVEPGHSALHAEVTVTDSWYDQRCFQRERFARSILQLWRKVSGEPNGLVRLEDRAGALVADTDPFQGIEVEGCE